ncbi:MAG: tRNA (adenosine(37)-N6)-threonylcarbamoyltransferase complex ATPase subunit type 1 TsaE [Candidatus Omnitrophota bacterium]|nr:tRNA (adenosine(37)-N6)-threonylcarbamoyltransferase complex ATPase subunit type 1 TsaE [Candidatus Omnitrophota bacterium]
MRLISASARQTINIGRKIAAHLKPADVLCLYGPFGAGKTVLAKGIAQGLGIKPGAVNSPSFVLVRTHTQGLIPLHHFDLYRLKETQDILNLGYEEYIYGNAVTVIEWAERLGKLVPKEVHRIELILEPGTKRLLKFLAFGKRYQELLREINEDLSH